jgi:hypothetical protein
MMSTIRRDQPPDPPTATPPSVLAEAEQSTEVAEPKVASAAPSGLREVTPPGATTAKSQANGTGTWDIHFPPFSAEVINTFGKETHRGKIYTIEKAMRMEGEEQGQKGITIIRYDRKVMWILMPEQKMYMEMGNLGAGADWSRLEGAKVQRESLGTEQVGPYHCDKSRVRVTYEGKVYTSIQWAAKELDGFVVKTQGEKGEWTTEYQNIRLGPQDPSLFEIPSGYQKMSMGGMQAPRP